MKSKTRINEPLLVVFISVFVGLICYIPLSKHNICYLGDDSIGYFGVAATIAGLDWGDILSSVDTFSYGYGLVLLPTILLARKSGDSLGYAAIINTLLLMVFFIACYWIVRRYFDTKKSILIALTMGLYSGNIVASQYYGADILVLTLYAIMIYVLCKFLDEFKYRHIFGLVAIASFIYASHRVAIVVVMSLFALFVILLVNKRIGTIHFCLYTVSQIVCFALARIGYSHFSTVFATLKTIDANSVDVRAHYLLEEIVTLEYWMRTARNLVRQFLYIDSATIGIAGVSILFFLVILLKIKKEDSINKTFYLSGFIICTVIMQIGVVSITLNPSYVYHLGMGRYVDYIVPFLVMIFLLMINDSTGALSLKAFGRRNRIVLLIVNAMICWIGAVAFQYDFASLEDKTVTGSGGYIGEAWVMNYSIPWGKVVLSLMILQFLYFEVIVDTEKNVLAICIICIGFFLFCVVPVINNELYEKAKLEEKGFLSTAAYLEENNISTVYWPYQNSTLRLRHFQVYCSTTRFHIYIGDDYTEQQLVDRFASVNNITNKDAVIFVDPHMDHSMPGFSKEGICLGYNVYKKE